MTEEVDNIDKLDLEAMATDTLEIEDDLVGIKISVCGHLEKGSGLTKYTVYLIRGEDREGPVEVYRRFSEFYALRELMLQRWPGCFVPATPDKKVLGKNDQMNILNRERFLDSFVKKLAGLPYLYYSQEFQMLLRSKENNVTDVFQKWSKPSYEDIINRYRDSFSELAGKEINAQTAVKISSFTSFLKNSQVVLSGYKDMAKRLALARSSLDKRFSNMFTRVLPQYEKTCLIEYVNYDESKLIYINPVNPKILEHGQITVGLCSKNPYWLIYDLIKFEDRDGEAFLAAIESRTILEGKRNDIDTKIRENQKDIQEVAMGNSTVKSVFSRGTKEEYKIKLQQENITLQKEKENLVTVVDIISALLAYITIDQYKEYKRNYYSKVFKAVSCYEINFVQNMYDIWNTCLVETSKFTGDRSSTAQTFYPAIVRLQAAKIEQGSNEYSKPAFEQKEKDDYTTQIEQVDGNTLGDNNNDDGN